MSKSSRIEFRDFVMELTQNPCYKWVPYHTHENALRNRDFYGEEITDGKLVLKMEGDSEITKRVILPMQMTKSDSASHKSPKTPLWGTFAALPLEEEEFLSFANSFGRLGPKASIMDPRYRTIRKDPKPNGAKGHVIRIATSIETFEFWKQEVATFNFLVSLDNAVESLDRERVRCFYKISPNSGKMIYYEHIYQGERIRGEFFLSSVDSQSSDPLKVGKAICLDIAKDRLRHYPVEVTISIGSDYKGSFFEKGESNQFYDYPFPVLQPRCLLGAMYWSFSQKLLGLSGYRRCSVCGKLGSSGENGSPKEMVHCKNGDWIHEGTEYDNFRKQKFRKAKRDKKIADGIILRKRGRPKKGD